MATDIYGVRVLDVDLEQREVRFRVFVVYYDSEAGGHMGLTERDPGFFLRLIWRYGTPIGELISTDDLFDEEWTRRNARWFVAGVTRTAVRNDPPDWSRLHDFYYESGGGWNDEEHLSQADYVVRVTDPAWIGHLSPGDSWGETAYPINADLPDPADLPHVPRLDDPFAVLTPFPDESEPPQEMKFSDDGRFLAMSSDEGVLAVYETAGWTEQARAEPAPGLFFPRLMWVPGRPVVTLMDRHGTTQHAYDVAARTVVEVPVEPGYARSRTGGHRIEYGVGSGVDFLGDDKRNVRLGPEDLCVEAVEFTADETRLFAAGMGPNLYVLELPGGRVVDTLREAGPRDRVNSLAVSPDGRYLAYSGRLLEYGSDGETLVVRRTADHAVMTQRSLGPSITKLAWSPDGQVLAAVVSGPGGRGGEVRLLPAGMPAEPPPELRPAVPSELG